jgi:DNA primase
VSWKELDELKQQIPLSEYLQTQDWKPARRTAGGRLMGLCPLHADRQPSFLLDPAKNLFYCYGCGLGGDVIRFVELYHGVSFGDAVARLWRWRGIEPLLEQVTKFCQMQLHRHHEAIEYLHQRGLNEPELIDELRIGYAPGRCLRASLMMLGYSLDHLQQTGLVNVEGQDTFNRRIVFPLEGNLYGRSIGGAAPHRFLPGSKGGLYGWEKIRRCPDIILVEGMFDLAALWQAGFRNATCAMGSYLNALQFRQLFVAKTRTVFVALDSDDNGSGQQAAQRLSRRLRAEGVTAPRVELPHGHDPASFFAGGGDARQFQNLLEQACL